MAPSDFLNGRISVHYEVMRVFPELVIGILQANIRNTSGNDQLWGRIAERSAEIEATMDEETIRRVEGIRAGKQAYRQLGKDPNRYRLSAEALMRRVAKGKRLYPISSAVDALNLVSLNTGITIGGFDADKITGNIELGIGRPGEEFQAIGRGPLNVENLPVYRDALGAIGNPTSDSERTMITPGTVNVLMLITGFFGRKEIDGALQQLQTLLKEYCESSACFTGFTVINQP
jgi:DNA/RNA-binding domain of Phe-tRNA-synthetase-like protein